MSDLFLNIDLAVFKWINQLAGESHFLDSFLWLIQDSYLIKGIPIIMLFWGLWFVDDRVGTNSRHKLIALLFASLVAIGIGRGLANLLPFRQRPIHNPDIDADLALGMAKTTLESASSFPSDHAVLFFSLALGLYLVKRSVGIIALLHAVIVVSLPRVLLGFHFPADILVGAVIGVAISLSIIPPTAHFLVCDGRLERVLSKYPHIVYPAMFFVTFQVASMFDSLRTIIGVLGNTAGGLMN